MYPVFTHLPGDSVGDSVLVIVTVGDSVLVRVTVGASGLGESYCR